MKLADLQCAWWLLRGAGSCCMCTYRSGVSSPRFREDSPIFVLQSYAYLRLCTSYSYVSHSTVNLSVMRTMHVVVEGEGERRSLRGFVACWSNIYSYHHILGPACHRLHFGNQQYALLSENPYFSMITERAEINKLVLTTLTCMQYSIFDRCNQ